MRGHADSVAHAVFGAAPADVDDLAAARAARPPPGTNAAAAAAAAAEDDDEESGGGEGGGSRPFSVSLLLSADGLPDAAVAPRATSSESFELPPPHAAEPPRPPDRAARGGARRASDTAVGRDVPPARVVLTNDAVGSAEPSGTAFSFACLNGFGLDQARDAAEQDRRASAAEVAALASALRATDARVERLADTVDTQLAEIKELLLRNAH